MRMNDPDFRAPFATSLLTGDAMRCYCMEKRARNALGMVPYNISALCRALIATCGRSTPTRDDRLGLESLKQEIGPLSLRKYVSRR